MTKSETINELAAALVKAQADMTNAKKDNINPHFKSKYADLASVREAVLPALTKHGLAVMQFPRSRPLNGSGWLVEVETVLVHTSGQFVMDCLAIPVGKVDAQAVGSALTYARRYSLAAVCGIAPEDDDANAAVARPNVPKAETPEAPEKLDEWLTDMMALTPEGSEALRAAWERAPKALRDYATKYRAAELKTIKDKARQVGQ